MRKSRSKGNNCSETIIQHALLTSGFRSIALIFKYQQKDLFFHQLTLPVIGAFHSSTLCSAGLCRTGPAGYRKTPHCWSAVRESRPGAAANLDRRSLVPVDRWEQSPASILALRTGSCSGRESCPAWCSGKPPKEEEVAFQNSR